MDVGVILCDCGNGGEEMFRVASPSSTLCHRSNEEVYLRFLTLLQGLLLNSTHGLHHLAFQIFKSHNFNVTLTTEC
jgi:hypothetical protein